MRHFWNFEQLNSLYSDGKWLVTNTPNYLDIRCPTLFVLRKTYGAIDRYNPSTSRRGYRKSFLPELGLVEANGTNVAVGRQPYPSRVGGHLSAPPTRLRPCT
jgi:hypothetical protein